MRPAWIVPVVFVGCLVIGPRAEAQTGQAALPPVVVDVRGATIGLGTDAVTARDLGVGVTALPARALGLSAGAQVFVVRLRRLSIGVGGDVVWARAATQPVDAAGAAAGPRVTRRFDGFSPTVTVNFGSRNGWSYLAAGMGPLRFDTTTGANAPADPARRKATIALGGGARWFNFSRVAYTFDVRFYQTRPLEIVGSHPGRSRVRVLVLSAGISVR